MNNVFSRRENGKCYKRKHFVDLEELKDVQLVDIPSNPQEYLVSVIAERRNLEEITHCDVDYKKYRKNQSLFYDTPPLPAPADALKPTEEWQHIQIDIFTELTSYVTRMRDFLEPEKKRLKLLRFKKNADTYWWRYFMYKYDPNLATVVNFKVKRAEEGLKKLLVLMKQTKRGDTIEQYIGRWVYALMACLKVPLHSDTLDILRKLAKQAWIIRSRIDPANETAQDLATPLSLIICIVGQYYGQLDLADNSEPPEFLIS